MGSSITKGTGVPLKVVKLSIFAKITAITIPVKYSEIITNALLFAKNAAVKKAYIGIFAEQLIKGVSIMVILRSLSEGRVLVDIIAGTEHPKPISMGTKLRPDKPILRTSLSIIKAILAIYPLSSRLDRKKKSITMVGRKDSTLPTPANIPLITRE